MDEYSIRGVLEKYKAGEISLQAALDELRDFPLKDLSFARLDTQREIRVGYPEIVYCAGKSAEQIRAIMEFMMTKDADILATRADESHFAAVRDLPPTSATTPCPAPSRCGEILMRHSRRHISPWSPRARRTSRSLKRPRLRPRFSETRCRGSLTSEWQDCTGF